MMSTQLLVLVQPLHRCVEALYTPKIKTQINILYPSWKLLIEMSVLLNHCSMQAYIENLLTRTLAV